MVGMAYRDVGSLLARLEVLEARCLRVRARAQRLAQHRSQRRLRWLARGIGAAVLLLFAFTFSVVNASLGYRCEANIAQAEHDTSALKAVATEWREDHGGRECPTVAGLFRDKEISASSRLTDPWGFRYELRCDGATVYAMSAGPDGHFGTQDDISR